MSALLMITETLDEAVDCLAELHPGNRRGFVCHVLQALERRDPDNAEAMLKGLQEDIATRLEEGRW